MQGTLCSAWNPCVSTCSALHMCPKNEKEQNQKGVLSLGTCKDPLTCTRSHPL